MTQFDFLATWQDSWDLITAILNSKAYSLTADAYYLEPNAVALTTFEEVRNSCLNGNRKFYISGTSFSTRPTTFRRVGTGVYEGKFVVEDNKGGPLLVLVLPACYRYGDDDKAMNAFENGNELHLSAGSLMYLRNYWNEAEQVLVPPSAAIKAGYKDLLQCLKTELILHQFHKPIWIGRRALEAVEKKEATIQGFGLD